MVVVVVAPPMIMEMDPLSGRLMPASRLPQYLMSAMLGWALAVDFMLINKLARYLEEPESSGCNGLHVSSEHFAYFFLLALQVFCFSIVQVLGHDQVIPGFFH